MSDDVELAELRRQAEELGVETYATINKKELRKRIAQAQGDGYALVEEIDPAFAELNANAVKASQEREATGETLRNEDDWATAVVTITDTDRVIGGESSTIPLGFSNQQVDLPLIYVPLNTPVELPKPYISLLESTEIIFPVQDKDGNSRNEIRNRFALRYHNDLTKIANEAA